MNRAAMVLACALALSPVRAAADGASRFFNASDGVRLHYLEAGAGRTLVFLPGWTMPAEIWAAQIRYFSRRYRVAAFDPRSQGDSDIAADGHNSERRARDIKELLDALDSGPVVLVGWSLAVLESLTYLRRYGSEQLAGLVLVDNSIGEEPPPSFDPTFLARLRADRHLTTEHFVRGMYRSERSEDYYQRIIARALKTPTDAAVELLSNREPRRLWRELVYGVDRPLLYVVSERFREQALNLKRNKPGVQIAVFARAGHALFVDEPQRFNALLERFARESFRAAEGRQ